MLKHRNLRLKFQIFDGAISMPEAARGYFFKYLSEMKIAQTTLKTRRKTQLERHKIFFCCRNLKYGFLDTQISFSRMIS